MTTARQWGEKLKSMNDGETQSRADVESLFKAGDPLVTAKIHAMRDMLARMEADAFHVQHEKKTSLYMFADSSVLLYGEVRGQLTVIVHDNATELMSKNNSVQA
jgi:hypothetical protein